MSDFNNNNPFDDVTRLIKKTEWPMPSKSLYLRIEHAVSDRIDITIVQPLWFTRSPLLSGLAIVTAIILGISSGFMTSGQASANSYNIYKASSPSIAQLYFGQDSEKEQ